MKKGENRYWGFGLAPVECQLVLEVGHLTDIEYKEFVRLCKSEKVYYMHNTDKKTVTLAFADEMDKAIHAVSFKVKLGIKPDKLI